MGAYTTVAKNHFKLKKAAKGANLEAHKIQSFSEEMEFQFQEGANVTFGRNIVSDGRGLIYVDKNATLMIGDGVYLNDGFKLSCKESVKIGSGCLFGPDVKIYDNNHKFTKEEGVLFEHTTRPVVIGEKCWIASNVVILAGTRIGDHCLIGAGCIVHGEIPAGSKVTQKNNLVIEEIQ
ncbi:acyltransferase [Eubacterium oxidoreducens]|uniref:Acetyltransferase (Isoleucine patch superfamily) n=1 Tax=Eubacterium oxidoreducens TaxID=1732 RepID=A0A1G6AE35_EUBOX|nr:acyltransferase [Eubacterium oxidoreducens]SDB06698.1 Acetyltransferase (isoleucine patch superfamily) [Eubacterium oxidoreducens]